MVYIRMQTEYKIMPNEVLKLVMGVKFQTLSNFLLEFTPQNTELKKLGTCRGTSYVQSRTFCGKRFSDKAK